MAGFATTDELTDGVIVDSRDADDPAGAGEAVSELPYGDGGESGAATAWLAPAGTGEAVSELTYAGIAALFRWSRAD